MASITSRQLHLLVLSPTPNRHIKKIPLGYFSLDCTEEDRRQLNKLAIETFMELSNKGIPFADCLGSLLLTGMHFAVESLEEQESAAPSAQT